MRYYLNKRGVYMFEFWKNEWKLFLEDISSVKNGVLRIFGLKKDYLMLDSSSQQEEQVGIGVQDETIKNNLIKYYLTIIRHKLNVLNSPEKESYEKQLILREERWK